MKVCYLDLNYPDLIEGYSRFPKKYGGGRCVPSALLHSEKLDFHIYADKKCFEGIEEKYLKYCHELSYEAKDKIRTGHPIKDFIEDCDIILHNFHGIKVNTIGTKIKDLVWLVGVNEHVHPDNNRVVLYNNFQHPNIFNPNTKIYYARIGVPIPPFQEYKKEDFVFSCHRQNIQFGSEIVMGFSHQYKFKYICAGPRESDFPNIMDYVDNQWVTYLGVIPEEVKIDHFKRARCSTYLHNWPVPFNLSLIQSLSYGTPVIATRAGFLPSIVKEGVNGFFLNKFEELPTLIEKCLDISQKSCYNSILEYSSDKMVEDYIRVFEHILK